MNAAEIAELIGPAVAEHGLEVDRVEVSAAGRRSVVQIYLDGDGPAGVGPSLDQIAVATRSIAEVLDASDVSRGRPYTLEVSSRGVGRPLTEARHFRRNRGRLVKVTTADTEITGRILAADEQAVELDVEQQAQRVPLEAITKALVQIELNRPLAGDSEDLED